MGIRLVAAGIGLAIVGATIVGSFWVVEPPRNARCLAVLATDSIEPIALCVCARNIRACVKEARKLEEADAFIAEARAQEQSAITLSKLLDIL